MTEEPKPRQVFDLSEWEGSKENVQPLKKGRNPLGLRNAFAPLQTAITPPSLRKAKLANQKQEWEEKISNYSGDDILSLWKEYIQWIEDNYPSLNKESGIMNVLERCTRSLLHDERYKDDLRYLQIWLKYADLCKDPLDIFAHLSRNKIGMSHALLYQYWATCLEDRGDYGSADKVLDEGIKRLAQPVEELKMYQRAFQYRMMKKISEQQREAIQQQMQEKQNSQRVAFQNLTKKQASSLRRPLAKTVPSRMNPIIQKSMPTRNKIPKKGNFVIYDENQAPQPKKSKRIIFEDDSEYVDSTWDYLPGENEKYKENSEKPSKWNTHRVPSRNKLLKPQQKPKMDFTIFVDEECKNEKQAPFIRFQ